MTASRSPFFTCVLKSALSSEICPEICEPTSTVTSAATEPVELMDFSTVPRSTSASSYETLAALPCEMHPPADHGDDDHCQQDSDTFDPGV